MTPRNAIARRSVARWAAIIGGLGIAAVVPSLAGAGDFGASPGDILAFWASSKALLEGLNPYDPATLQTILNAANEAFTNAPEVYYPPWLFTLIWWFGLLDAQVFATLWLFVSLLALVASSYLALRYFGLAGPGSTEAAAGETSAVGRWVPLVFLITFHPFIVALDLGQLTPVVLVGFVVFAVSRLRGDRRSQVLSVIGLTVAAFKPHLIYLVYVDVVVRAVRRRRWPFVAAAAGGFALLCLVPLLFAARIYTLFVDHDTAATVKWFTPTAGAWLRHLFGTDSTLVWLAPTLVAMMATAVVALRSPEPEDRAGRADADARLMTLVAVSALTAPYLWTYDLMLLMPVGLYIIAESKRRLRLGEVPFAAPVLIVANLAMIAAPQTMRFHIWYPLVVLGLLLLVRRTAPGEPSLDTEVAVATR